MLEFSIKNYIDIAFETNVLKPHELEILDEILKELKKNPETTYTVINEVINNELAGFIIFGKTPLADFGWDIYWIVVRKSDHGKGTGKKLIALAEEVIKNSTGRAVVRIETSGKKEYAKARGLYERTGFTSSGKIPNFYAEGDDLLIFYKELEHVQN